MLERTKRDKEITQIKGILLGVVTIALSIFVLVLCIIGRIGGIIGAILLIIYIHAAIPFAKHLGYQTCEDYFADVYHVSLKGRSTGIQPTYIDVPAVGVNTINANGCDQSKETEELEKLSDLVSKVITNLKHAIGLEFGSTKFVYTMDNTLYHIIKNRNPISIRLCGELNYSLKVIYDDRGIITDILRDDPPVSVIHDFPKNEQNSSTTLSPDEKGCFYSEDEEIVDIEGIPENDIINARKWYTENETLIKDSCVNAANNSSDFFDCDISNNNIYAIKLVLETAEGFSFKVKKLSDPQKARVYFAG